MENILNIISKNSLELLPLIGLYAETHFRFRIPFSRYFKKEPELLFDTPWRLEPGQKLSIFLVVKDAHLYPTQLIAVDIDIFQKNQKLGSQSWSLNNQVQDRQVDFEFVLTDFELPPGEIDISPRLRYSVKGKPFEMVIDNYSQTHKDPLRVTVATEELPKMKGWQIGDTHLHTSLTDDQIEFGATLEMTKQAAIRFGLDFIAATDHSYDLDDQPDNYLENDPDLRKWKQSRKQIAEMNQSNTLTIIPGEEISVANQSGDTVHLLHYNDPVYYPGNGDSGEDWPKVTSQLSIDDVLDQRSPRTVSVGAHTVYKFPWFQRVLLKRGHWESQDHKNPALDGVQILCGTPAYSAFHASRQHWIEALLKGHKLGVYGGSDGHGCLNRNWHIKMPMWSMGTHEDQIFAQSRTLLRSSSTTPADLVEAMKNRRSALSTGPIGDLTITSQGKTGGIGDTMEVTANNMLSLYATGSSSEEFGSLMDVSIYAGNIETGEEILLHQESDVKSGFEITQELSSAGVAYLRLELSSEGSRWPGVYVSSPIWLNIATL